MEITIEDIVSDIQKRVENNESISPSSWCEAALRVNILGSSMDNQLAEYEAVMATSEAVAIQQGDSAAKAKALAKMSIDYKEYLKLKAKFKRLDEWIKLAKRRAIINEI